MKKSEIEIHIKRLQNGRAATNDAHQLELIDLGLSKYRKMLDDLEKKTEDQPIEKTRQSEQEPKKQEKTKAQKWEEVREKLPVMAKAYDEFTSTAPTVEPKPTITLHFAGKQHPGTYTRGDLRSLARQNFTLIVESNTLARCIAAGNFSELWSMKLYYNLHLAVQGLKKLEGKDEYRMEELFIKYWLYSEGKQETGRSLAEFLKLPKPE